MVQETRLDLSVRPAFYSAALLGLALLASPALAQDGPLTTLMRPQPLGGPAPLTRDNPLAGSDRLFGENPLANVDSLNGEGSLTNPRPVRPTTDPAKPGEQAATCDPRSPTRPRPPARGLAGGGSGPGEYGQFLPGGRPETPARGAAKPVDPPLYGGVDRPLWGDPAPRTASTAPGLARAGSPARSDAPSPPSVSTPGVDRPLWADANPRRLSTAEPCEGDPATRRARTPSTMYFGSEPGR